MIVPFKDWGGSLFMGEFLAQYWLEFFLGLIAMSITFAVKSHAKWTSQKKKEEQVTLIKDIVKEVKEELSAESQRLKQQSDEADFCIEEEIGVLRQDFEVLKKGILSIQKRDFKRLCEDLLKPGHNLTLEEYRQCCDEHDVYNRLGGNSDGDTLFELVRKKAEVLFTQEK